MNILIKNTSVLTMESNKRAQDGNGRACHNRSGEGHVLSGSMCRSFDKTRAVDDIRRTL